MKKFILPALIFTIYILLNAFNSNKSIHNFSYINSMEEFSGGSPAGKTGAPGEPTCTQCHAGALNDGSTTSSLTHAGSTNTYDPGVTYNMTLTINNGNSKNGFQVVAIDASGSNAGNLIITSSTTKKVTDSGFEYVTHTNSGNLQTSWDFDWTAPASNSGAVTFYYAYNVSNSNSATNGDNIYSTQVTFQENSGVGLSSTREKLDESLSVNYNNSILFLDFNYSNNTENSFIKLIDLQGKVILQKNIALNSSHHYQIELNKPRESGIYLVSLFLDNNIVSRKIYID